MSAVHADLHGLSAELPVEDVINALSIMEQCAEVTHGGSRIYRHGDYEAMRRRLIVAIGKLRSPDRAA